MYFSQEMCPLKRKKETLNYCYFKWFLLCDARIFLEYICLYRLNSVLERDKVEKELCNLVKGSPLSVCHIPEAIQYIATSENILGDNKAVSSND